MDKLSGIKNELLAERVEEQIYQYMIDNSIQVGQKIPNEFELGKMFGVGRSTVREAVKLMISKGILEIRRGSGTYVVSLSATKYDPLGLNQIADKKRLALDLANVRLMLEPEIAAMSALNATDEDIQKMEKLCIQVEKKIKNNENYIDDDIAFHCAIAESSKNKVVEQLIPIIDTTVMMFVNITHKEFLNETIETHRATLEAIKRRDTVGAKMAMMMHLTYNRQKIIKVIEREDV